MKISIIGHSASGKSFLARKIASEFDIPHLHLDRFWFEAGGNKIRRGDEAGRAVARAHVVARTKEFLANNEKWVSDGLYPAAQAEIAAQADEVVFLDIPFWRRLGNHYMRMVFRDNRHKELSLWDEFNYFPELVVRHFRSAPKLKAIVESNRLKIVRLRTREKIEAYFEKLRNKAL
jgi:adenylate kinase family enzyme